MIRLKPKCEICDELLEGKGYYTFSYLGEVVYLCGFHAQKVMKFIKGRKHQLIGGSVWNEEK